MPAKRLSAIEYTVLGIAWKRGPCTTYAIMKELASSTSTFYKSRAGTAYPIVNRLLDLELLSQADSEGVKGDKLVSVTAKGENELRQWLAAPVSLEEVSHTMDNVRLRVFYLGAATPEERETVLDDAIESLKSYLAECGLATEKYEKMGDTFSCLATEGVILETQARIEWLKRIRERAVAAKQGKPV